MSKQRFKIPTSLDMSYLDLEFNFRTKSGMSFNKPIGAKTVVLYLLSGMILFYIMMNTFISSSIPVAVVFAIAWFLLTILLAKTDKTKRSGIELMIPLLGYFSPNNRALSVRQLDPVGPLKSIYGVDSVDEEDGLIQFIDGTVGYAFQVVGSASILMFDADKNQILEKVDSFYKKLTPDVELIYDTNKESQKTDRQVQTLQGRYAKLKTNSPGLKHLYREQHQTLTLGVGNRFKSLHQYLIVKANSRDHLEEFINLFVSDLENEQIMFKYGKALGYKGTEEYFAGVFASKK